MKTWRDKANNEIASMCMAAYLQANTKKDGSRYKKHRPYAIPELAQQLVDCLGNHDQKAGEIRAKQIFCWELQTAND